MKFLDTASLQLVSFVDHLLSEYAVLSYTWSQPADELTYRDADQLASAGNSWPGRGAAAFRRVLHACRQAQARNIRYLWVDSLCVDQSSSADVAESVTASFRLIWDAALCIVHLSDLSPAADDWGALVNLEKALSGCRWFTRGWTLQELVAAPRVEFFDRDWNPCGVKAVTTPRPWLEMLSRVSSVDVPVLADRDALYNISLGRRISWAAHRRTGRPEDAAYALMGICGVEGRLAPRYGEGGRCAFVRLQEKIVKRTRDLSILAWIKPQRVAVTDAGNQGQKDQSPFAGVLAESAAHFRHFASISPWDSVNFDSDYELSFNNRGLCVKGLLSTANQQSAVGGEPVLVLNASWRSPPGSVHVGISLQEVEPGLFVRSNSWKLFRLSLRKDEFVSRAICILGDVSSGENRRMYWKQKNLCVSAWVDGIITPSDAPYVHPAVSQRSAPERCSPTSENAATNGENVEQPLMPGPAFSQQPAPDRHNLTSENAVNNQGTAKQTTMPGGVRRSKRSADEMLKSDHSTSLNSTEEDVLLFDSLPEKPERLDKKHKFYVVLPELVTLGLQAWNEEKAATAGEKPSDQASPEEQKGNSSASISWSSRGPISIPLRPRKVARLDTQQQEDYTAETDQEDPDTCLVNRKHKALPDQLACPFYKLDPARHHSCMWELELPNTRTIKQHVIVDHRIPEHCPVCHSTFASATDRDQHIVSRSCSERKAPAGLLMGVSEDQVEKLSQPDDRKMRAASKPGGGISKNKRRKGKISKQKQKITVASEKEKWSQIWAILFPGVAHPESAHLSAPREREAVALRHFWKSAGPEIVAESLKARGLLQWEEPDEEAALAALHASVLLGMVEASGLLAFPAEGDRSGAGSETVCMQAD